MKQPKRYITFVVMMLLVLTSNAGSFRVVSPDGRIELDFWLEAGKPFYALSMEGRRVLSQSSLGYKLSKEDWTQNLLLKNYKESTMDYKWYQPWGEEDSVRCHYNELMVQLSRPESAHRMDIYFRVFNEGAGIRYVFHGSTPKDSIIVISEETQFSLAHDAEAWSIPAHPENFYEHEFEASLVSKKDTVCTPLTIHFEKDIYMALHEAALLDYAKMNLTVKDFCLQSDLSPWANSNSKCKFTKAFR
jgi:alpha-glucosidase